jgi:crossover junction endodeoxyribonuclease RusA
VVVPVDTVSTLNRREHWAARARRAKEQRVLTACLVASACNAAGVDRTRGVEWLGPVTLTRICTPRRKIRDDDNLRAALKSVRDGVADALHVDDSMRAGVEWRYRQEAQRGASAAVLIHLEVIDAAE